MFSNSKITKNDKSECDDGQNKTRLGCCVNERTKKRNDGGSWETLRSVKNIESGGREGWRCLFLSYVNLCQCLILFTKHYKSLLEGLYPIL